MKDYRTLPYIFLLLVLVSVAIAVGGCGVTLTTEEREAQHAYDRDNLAMCAWIKGEQGEFMMSDHDHRWGKWHKPHEVKADLHANACRAVVPKDYWLE